MLIFYPRTMDILLNILDLFIHLDHHLNSIIANYGTWTYLILCLIIFCETGLVVTPFLPGDSLLFAVGALAATGPLKIELAVVLLSFAAILGDSVNYAIGHTLAPKIFRHENIRFIKKEYLIRTEQFYAKYGGKTIIFARFIPIIRTFAPFLAGVGSMSYRRFAIYNVAGGILWVTLFIMSGFYFGNLPLIKRNFTLVIFAIIIISILPGVFEFLRHRKKKVIS